MSKAPSQIAWAERPMRPLRWGRRKWAERAFANSVLVGVLLWLYFPLYWLATMSLKYRVDIISVPPKWTFKPTLDNYRWILESTSLLPAMGHSLIVATGTTLLAGLLGLPAAYGFARFQFRRKEELRFWILTTRMLPPVAVIIPFYLIWTVLGLYNTYTALVVTYLVVNLPLVIWLMEGFFREIPQEIEEAAMADGCSRVGAFLRVAIPLAVPGVAAALMLTFLFTWNEFFFAFILTSTKLTLPVAVASFMTSGLELKYGEMAAAGIIASLPAVVLVVFARNVIVRGLLGLVR